MTSRVLLVLIVDGLRARSLGSYGNTWYPTPALDELAAGGTLFERMLAESNDLPRQYDAFWSVESSSSGESTSLIAQLRDEGFYCHLVTDDSRLVERSDVQHFDEATLVDATSESPVDNVMECGIAATLAAAADRLGEWSTEYEQPRLMWVHLRGLTADWDAPSDQAESLLGEEDPPLEPSTLVPDGQLSSSAIAEDDTLHAACRYAGQIMALDASVGAFTTLVEELWPETPVDFVLAGSRGFALGEHGWLGLNAPLAHRELFHVPLIVKGSSVPSLRRVASFAQSSDLARIVRSLSKKGEIGTRWSVLARGCSAQSHYVETDDWSFVSTNNDPQQPGELYVLPDDQWQANNVASICPDEVSQLAQLAKGGEAASEQESI